MRTTEPAVLVEPMMAMLPSSSSPDRKSRPPGPGQSRLLSLPGGTPADPWEAQGHRTYVWRGEGGGGGTDCQSAPGRVILWCGFGFWIYGMFSKSVSA